MTTKEYFSFIVDQIHSTVVATVDNQGLPVTCVIDMMYADENGLYFLTAKGKNFYNRLISGKYLALSGMKGEDTMSRVAVSVRGKVREIGSDMLPLLFEKSPYMNEIYPNEKSRCALTVFHIYEGSGESFDLSKKTIERDSFFFGINSDRASGYYITDKCNGCKACLNICPQRCIDMISEKTMSLRLQAVIRQNNCLHCGNCKSVCPAGAVIKT